MARVTRHYKRSFSSSLGSGLGSVFGGSGKEYYILEHKNNSRYHRTGESQEIIIDQIEIGRDPKCQVRFDDSFSTVSRRHAAIIRSGDKWKLVQLSKTNPTLLNGAKVEHEWYLQNGDEIQLSVGGPKLGFITPSGNKSAIGSLRLTRRLNLFRQQALRPYKLAVTIICIILCLALAGAVGWGIYSHQKQEKLLADNSKIEGDLEKLKKETETVIDVHDYSPFIFAITLDKKVITFQGQRPTVIDMPVPTVVGTGFLLNDGRFVTARHVLEPWYFYEVIKDDAMLRSYNITANNGGSVVYYFTAISSSGKTFSFNSSLAKINRTTDKIESIRSGTTRVVVRKAVIDNTDWAVYPSNETSGFQFNNALSSNLQTGAELGIFGFPYGRGAESSLQIEPIYSTCNVARQGLDVNGTIMVSNDNTERGNAGGPVLIKNGNTYQIVGVMSGSTFAKGRIVPISAVQ